MFESAGFTDKGQRKHNEDSYLIDEEQGLFVVADGVGGLQAGEIASELVCQVVKQHMSTGAELEDAIARAHSEVIEATKRGEGRSGMASTIVVARFDGFDYKLAWVGDSRIYLWDGTLKLLTKDHSYVQSLYDAGQISLAETDTHPKKNVITQAVGGTADRVKVAVNRGTLAPGNSLLLCSDGVSGELSGAQLLEYMSSSAPVQEIAQALVMTAINAGGKDNATCVFVRVNEELNVSDDDGGQTARSYKPEVFRVYDAANDSYLANSTPSSATDLPAAVPESEGTIIVRAQARTEEPDQKRTAQNTVIGSGSLLGSKWWLLMMMLVGLIGLYLWLDN